ncbi:hypothetical protein IMZ48_29420 [Candidatus Bathyarchaeota archaeon]|nr:hypothetical protein [Candidatus Bathyarchaeota archaeon]
MELEFMLLSWPLPANQRLHAGDLIGQGSRAGGPQRATAGDAVDTWWVRRARYLAGRVTFQPRTHRSHQYSENWSSPTLLGGRALLL